MEARSVAMATSNSPPKTGRLSTQLACALARRCMKGERAALSGVNPFAGTFRRSTSWARIPSISSSRSSAQAMKLVSAIELGEIMAALPGGTRRPDELPGRPGIEPSREAAAA
jgi:hypothetical protein